MTQIPITNSYTFGPRSGNKPASMVILLHGLGSNGRDLISLAPLWAESLPDTVFISPDAPYPCDMAPVGHQWFSLLEWTPESMLRGARQVTPALEHFIEEQLRKYDVPASKLALCGFSQGTMMSLYAGPRYKEKIAGILGYSGAIIGGEEFLEIAAEASFHKMPVHLIHGEADMVVPLQAWHHAKRILEDAKFPVTGHTTPWLPHSIDDHGIKSGGQFLKSVLAG